MSQFSSWLYAQLPEVSTALTACLLIVFGADINRLLRKSLRRQNFIVRTAVFIFVNAVGFGMVIIKLSPWISMQLKQLPIQWLCIVLVSLFVLIGTWAQRNRHV
ncbi:DUF3392 domain-containing protein [Echinimonas agarilytica]|uniref:DUF3392 domain-containing protein n=1 Tax=Echinimonas agarilytica TaxID=1215918 RepID=A0AA41W6N5_9GAMM|nr:DUF3392 domain-containing protein [Echinimonas agarilytica]